MSAEAGESTLKPLIHEIEYIKKLSCKKINTADKMLKKLFDAEKHFDLSFSKVFESMETATDDLDTLSASLESFTENSVELQDVFESVKGLIEKTTT